MEHRPAQSSKLLSIYHILDGLREGLSSFSAASRAALIFAERPQDPLRIYDPQDLLRGHEPKLKSLYLDQTAWRVRSTAADDFLFAGQMQPEENLGLTGLVSFGARTRAIFYQMWFTEHHPDMCSIGPTERWLEQAAFLLAHDFAFQDASYAGTSGYVLREYATHAVRDFVLDELNLMLGWDTKVLVYPILDAVLAISKTPEEGSWPRGNLVFIEQNDLTELEFLVRFPQHSQPSLRNHKHVRKLLLSVEGADRKLVSDGRNIVGIVSGALPARRVTADFRDGYGFLRLAGRPVCSFADGRFLSSNRRANLVHLEEALLETDLDPTRRDHLFRIVTQIVQEASESRFGCTIVLDFNTEPLVSSGQQMTDPLNLLDPTHLSIARSMARIDGALHIGTDLQLHAFACLLDGHSVPGENLSRGARFNSALRYTAEKREMLVVVVSSDRPVSIIQGGVELSAACEWKPFSKCRALPPTLDEWLTA